VSSGVRARDSDLQQILAQAVVVVGIAASELAGSTTAAADSVRPLAAEARRLHAALQGCWCIAYRDMELLTCKGAILMSVTICS
jgi:hypothetical protein